MARTALVTGASSGIGAACATRLTGAGWRVFAGVRRAGDAPTGTEEILLDVTDEDQVRAAAERVEELHGLVDTLRRRPHLVLVGDVEQDLLSARRCVPGAADTGEDTPARARETDRAGRADSR